MALVLVALGLWAAFASTRKRGKGSPPVRAAMATCRFLALALVAFCLLQPALVLSTVVPQESFVGLVVDDSASLRIADQDGARRADWVARQLQDAPDSLLGRLREKFKVRMFSFSDSGRRIAGLEELAFDGSTSQVEQGLGAAADQLRNVALSGLVVLTDGVDTSNRLSDRLLDLRSQGVPVYPVGLGTPRYDLDLEVQAVDAPETVLIDSVVQVDVTVAQTGLSGRTVRLFVEDEGRIVSEQNLQFPTSGEAASVPVTLRATTAGPRRFTFRVDPVEDEVVLRNNARTALIDVQDRVDKVLYFEGELRYEYKFIRRAVEPDENLQLVSIIRAAESRFQRQGVDSAEELADGFPVTREELFGYKALVLGSVEASFFTYEQMRMILDFAARRGGSVIFLGGRYAFSEGGYAGTPLAELMPVDLGPASGGEGEPTFSYLDLRLTEQGRHHPALQFGADAAETLELWRSLPQEVSTFNVLTRLKPGATALMMGKRPELDGEQVVLAHHRYGEGRAIAFSIHDTYNAWQMHAEVPLEDTRHERFWRQLLRWATSSVPDSLEVTTRRDRVGAGDRAEIVARVRDEAFLEINRANVVADVTSPSGAVTTVPLEWSAEEDGRFEGAFPADELGFYDVVVDASAADGVLGSGSVTFEAADLGDEYFGAQQRTEFLADLAGQTGGRSYSTDQIDDLIDDLSFSGDGATVREYRDLWDMPALFLALLALLATEWTLRRLRGYP